MCLRRGAPLGSGPAATFAEQARFLTRRSPAGVTPVALSASPVPASGDGEQPALPGAAGCHLRERLQLRWEHRVQTGEPRPAPDLGREAEGTAPPSPARSKRHGRSLGPTLLPPLLPRTCLSEEGTHLQPHQTQAGPDNPDEGHRQGVTCERLTGQDREPNPAPGRAGDLCQLGKLAPQNGGSQGHQAGLAFWVWGVCKTEPRLMVTPRSLDLTPGAQDQTGWFLQDEARVGHSKLFGPALVTCQLKKRGNKLAPHCGTPGQRQQGTKAPP